MPYGSTLNIPPTNYHLLAAKQEPYPKSHLLTKNTADFFKAGIWASRQKKEKTERATEVGRGTREERVNWNEMTTLRFQRGGEASDIHSLLSGRRRGRRKGEGRKKKAEEEGRRKRIQRTTTNKATTASS